MNKLRAKMLTPIAIFFVLEGTYSLVGGIWDFVSSWHLERAQRSPESVLFGSSFLFVWAPVISCVVETAICALCGWGIWRRRNWARILGLVWLGLQIGAFLALFAYADRDFPGYVGTWDAVILVIAAVLLLVWFFCFAMLWGKNVKRDYFPDH